MKTPRRRLLQSAAWTAGLAAMPCHPDAEAQAAQPPFQVSGELVTPGAAGGIARVKLGRYEVSRLIIGSNPFYGVSHFNRLLSSLMTEWYTPERVLQVVGQCERQGVNTWQLSYHDRSISDLKRHRAEGGRLQAVVLSRTDLEDKRELLGEVVKLNPIGIVHHGGSAERKRREGKIGQVRDFLKRVRDAGVMVGLSLHDPTLLEQVESENWDVDFYMTSLYYLTRTAEEFRKLLGTRPLGEVYVPEDPERMCAAIRRTRRTCLCYKVLAAGRLTDTPQQIDQAFRFAFEHIKPQDCLIIGMYPRYADQVADNAARVRRILGGKQPG